MRIGGRSSGGVSEQDRRRDHTYTAGAADGRGAARMTSINVPERMTKLTDGGHRPETRMLSTLDFHERQADLRDLTW